MRNCVKSLRGGHFLGLHFDETTYDAALSAEELMERAEKERRMLEEQLQVPVQAVSMHRPSQKALDGDWKFANMVNSYSTEFFHEFKYLSDSRRRWREPVEQIIESGDYPRLHILTHAFWYHETSQNLHESMLGFLRDGNAKRYQWMADNFTDLDVVVKEREVL